MDMHMAGSSPPPEDDIPIPGEPEGEETLDIADPLPEGAIKSNIDLVNECDQ